MFLSLHMQSNKQGHHQKEGGQQAGHQEHHQGAQPGEIDHSQPVLVLGNNFWDG